MKKLKSKVSKDGKKQRILLVMIVVLSVFFFISGRPVIAQTLNFGTLSNFDVFNDTGQECHGFEIEVDGISSADVIDTFGGTYIRYGNPRVTDFPDGVYIRYESQYDPVNQVFTQTTPLAPSVIVPTDGQACWTGGSGNYLTSGCEHFGVSITGNPTRTVYHWLVEDPGTPGKLITFSKNANIPAPVWNVVSSQGGQPVVQANLPAEPPEMNGQYGDALWVKVFVKASPDGIQLDHLVTDDPVVPQEASETETEWAILQGGPNGAMNSELVNEGEVGSASQSVTRRYEFYEYTGVYDPENHEVKCGGDGSCNQPMVGEIGNYVGAQIAAINLVELPLQLTIASSLPGGEIDVFYDAPCITGGTPPYTINLSKGKLPAGLSIDPDNGRISGTPVAPPRSYNFTIQVTDQSGASVTGAFKVKIVKTVRINTLKLRSGKTGKPYNRPVRASLGKSPYTWTLTEGSLPAGLTLQTSRGLISGVPTEKGEFEMTLQVTDSLGGKDERSFRLMIK